VERFNLSQQPMAFAGDAEVKAALHEKGEGALPLIKMDGKVQILGTYPSREQLATLAGVGTPAPSIYTEAVQELVSIGAAIASNCQPCFKFHYDKARKLGVSREDMLRAVKTAQGVKEVPAGAVLNLAERFLNEQTPKVFETPETKLLPTALSTSCCGGSNETNGSCC
jgi:AhpD family alkylhydroperoxidase